jgi:hypothetical protein
MATETQLILEQYDRKVIEAKLDGQPEVPESTRKTRFQICQSCENLNKTWHRCEICKCWMPVKARLPGTKCPQAKW